MFACCCSFKEPVLSQSLALGPVVLTDVVGEVAAHTRTRLAFSLQSLWPELLKGCSQGIS